jgi:hypothetical protein
MIITAFFIQGILYSIKIYLNSGAEATDIPNATLIIGPVADLNFNFVNKQEQVQFYSLKMTITAFFIL